MAFKKYFTLIGVFLGAWFIIAFANDPREGKIMCMVGFFLAFLSLIYFLEIYRKSIIDEIRNNLQKDSKENHDNILSE